VYRVPSSGGEAASLTQESGVAVNYHPRYSPDGSLIAFISDRKGQSNLWLMNADGSDPRPVFTDMNVRASSPAWTPDGQYILVRRDWVGPRGRDVSDHDDLRSEQGPQGRAGIWMYHRDGGDGVALVGTEVSGATWPAVSPDGRYVYFHRRSGGRDALKGHYQVQAFDLRTGKRVDVTAGDAEGAASGRVTSGGAFAPEISPGGRWLAFGRQIPDGTISFKGHEFGPRTALWVRDLETGAERIVMDPISVAIESGSKSLRILPGYSWTNDGESIVLSQGGKLRRLNVASGEVSTIPFSARVHRTISEMAFQPFRITDGPFDAKFLRWHTASPDGSRLAYQAVGRIWTQELPDGAPRRLTSEDFPLQEFAPAWSPDGRWIAFTTWVDGEGGHVWKVRSRGGNPQRLTSEAGEYVHPSWNADGSELVLVRGSGATARGRTVTHNPWWDVVRLPAGGGDPQFVTRVALPAGTGPNSVARRAILHPSYGPQGRIFFPEFQRDGGIQTVVVSVAPDGSDRREHMILPSSDEAVPSPDGRWIAFQEGDNVFLTAFPWMGTGSEPVDINKRDGKLPIRQLSLEGGLFPRWRDAATVEFGSGNRYFAYQVDRETADTVTVALSVPRRIPEGTVALTGARIVTLAGDGVIESGTVVVDGSRITCVGACGSSGADRVIDASGKTIVPGFIDMHAHHYREHRGYRPLRDYEAAMYLAYGVTANLDNSMWSQNVLPTAELIEAGHMIGPRTYSTGDPLYGFGDAARQNALKSYEVAQQEISRLQSWGVVSLKQYMQPRRDQRQWVSHVAREKGLMVTSEGGDLAFNLGMIMDGQTAWEHPLSYVPIHSDVARFFGMANAVYSPTFVVAGPGPWNIDYFFAESDVWKDPKHRRWMPWRMLAGHLRRRTLRPDTDYSFPLIAQGLADVIAQGGWGAIGSHGEHHGPNVHWEIWMAASALGNMGALDLASRHGAYFLGAMEDLGTIEAGKLADLVVLNANPLDDIRSTMDMLYVMKGGVLYQAETLDEIWPTATPFGPYYWVDEEALRDDTRPVGWWDGGRER
jgi:Tol biopolymer transport system component